MTTNAAIDTTTAREGGARSSAAVIAVAFAVVALDFFDTTSIGFVVPTLAREWGLPPAAFTSAFVGTSLGAVIGYMSCGPLAKRFGRRWVGAASILLFSLGTLATMLVDTVTALAAIRLVTAIGLGATLPIAVDAAADVMPQKYKGTAAMIVITGGGMGSMIGGIAGGPLIANFGWKSVFLVGGVLPLLLLPAAIYYFRDNVLAPQGAAPGSSDAPARSENLVKALLRGRLALDTMLLWTFSFIVFVDAYALIFWIPSLLVDFGFPPAAAPAGTAAYGMGGLIGSIFVMAVIAKIGPYKALLLTTAVAIVSIGVMSQTTNATQVWILVLIGGMGAGFITGCVGQSALAVTLYPAWLRTTGVGWAAAMGRVGSILGPAVGGALLSLGWASRNIILLAIVPAIAAMVMLFILQWIEHNKEKSARAVG